MFDNHLGKVLQNITRNPTQNPIHAGISPLIHPLYRCHRQHNSVYSRVVLKDDSGRVDGVDSCGTDVSPILRAQFSVMLCMLSSRNVTQMRNDEGCDEWCEEGGRRDAGGHVYAPCSFTLLQLCG